MGVCHGCYLATENAYVRVVLSVALGAKNTE